MENKANPEPFAAPQMCAKCCSFYANPQFGTYCSKCFKELNLNPATQKQPEKIEKEEIVQNSALEEQSTVKQVDHSVCWTCCKKAGIMAYKCKCEYTFCKKHRLPESHSCDYDFIGEGKKELSKANPNLQQEKIEKI